MFLCLNMLFIFSSAYSEARVKGVQLRWWQPRHGGTGKDQWALDHVEVVLWVDLKTFTLLFVPLSSPFFPDLSIAYFYICTLLALPAVISSAPFLVCCVFVLWINWSDSKHCLFSHNPSNFCYLCLVLYFWSPFSCLVLPFPKFALPYLSACQQQAPYFSLFLHSKFCSLMCLLPPWHDCRVR